MGSETEAQQASYFQDAALEWGGSTFHFSVADGRALIVVTCEEGSVKMMSVE